jgi:hypothetical protein
MCAPKRLSFGTLLWQEPMAALSMRASGFVSSGNLSRGIGFRVVAITTPVSVFSALPLNIVVWRLPKRHHRFSLLRDNKRTQC